jgi:hypothetical protein
MKAFSKRMLKILLIVRRRQARKRSLLIKRRWGVRPVLRERKRVGEFYVSFLKYKIIDHEWFFLYTRMTPAQFDTLLLIVGPLLCKNSNREPLSPAQRLAITLRYIITYVYYSFLFINTLNF